VNAACRFFLCESWGGGVDEENSTDDDDKKLLLQANLGNKLTKKKKKEVHRALKAAERKKDRRATKITSIKMDFFPIDLLHDAHAFTEKLYKHLRSIKAKFDVKLLVMKVLARLIGRHKLLFK
jgi:protein SDA1